MKECQKLLKLLDEDVKVIVARVLPKSGILSQALKNDSQQIEKTLAPSVEITQISPSKSSPLLKPENYRSEFEELYSECSMDYTLLRDLLKEGKWKEADLETARVMLNVVTQEKQRFIAEQKFLTEEDIKNFPCTDLYTIDRLWVKYSKGRFGLSIQNKIWSNISAKLRQAEIFKEAKTFYNFNNENWFLDAVYSRLVFEKFTKTVRWTKGSYLPDHIYFDRPNLDPVFYNRRQQQEYDLNRHFLPYNNVNFSLDSVIGHLPTIPGWQPRIYYFLPGIFRGFLGTGRSFRYFLIDGEIEQPKAELIDYKQLKTKLADQPFLIQYPSELSMQTHYFSAFASKLKSCRPLV